MTADEKMILNGCTLFDSEKKINLIPQKRKVGYMFQDYALFPNMTVEKNIMAGMGRKPKRKSCRIISAVSVWKDWSIIFRGNFPEGRCAAPARMMASSWRFCCWMNHCRHWTVSEMAGGRGTAGFAFRDWKNCTFCVTQP